MGTKYGNEKKDRLKQLVSPGTAAVMSGILEASMPTILKISLWQIEQPWEVPERRIDDTMLWAVGSGSFVCHTDDGGFHLEAGNLLFVPAGKMHAFRFAEGCSSGRVFIIHMLYPLFQENHLPGSTVCSMFSLAHHEYFFPALMRAVAMRNFDQANALRYTRNTLRQIFIELAASGQIDAVEKGEAADPRVGAALQFLRIHFAENIGVPEIAESVNLHDVQFRVIFLKATGISPYQYLLQYRLQKAVVKLINTTMPLEELAPACGFRSSNHFCQSFRKHFNMSPIEYRRRWSEL